jgi:hypothetical protein
VTIFRVWLPAGSTPGDAGAGEGDGSFQRGALRVVAGAVVTAARLRVTRAYNGQATTRTASTAFRRPAPSTIATTIARMTAGKANPRSAIRITVSSTHRPKNPAQAPSSPPTSSDMATSRRASGRSPGPVEHAPQHVPTQLVLRTDPAEHRPKVVNRFNAV